jgi:hypothetical protein
MRPLNFRKTTPRTFFTTLFGSVGKRRTVFFGGTLGVAKRTKMQMIRRAHQGWRNKKIGTFQAIKIRLKYGRRKPVPQFRR